ncbi:hypothetical protein IFM89_016407 [Coptis chinensis]|uniref:Protein kinase domain-containing protein n=1 Tax=Coptis chinensis TaxID=261450 RepID=A0A835LRX3_9MAGN|nr:hypothetical protein IFM89_016407 [Coptis chinensis]
METTPPKVQHVTKASSDELLSKFAEMDSESRNKMSRKRDLQIIKRSKKCRRDSNNENCESPSTNGTGLVERKSLIPRGTRRSTVLRRLGIRGMSQLRAREVKNKSLLGTIEKGKFSFNRGRRNANEQSTNSTYLYSLRADFASEANTELLEYGLLYDEILESPVSSQLIGLDRGGYLGRQLGNLSSLKQLYLHSTCLYVTCGSHCNLKAANILLDNELLLHFCDCGLAVLRPLTTNSVKLKTKTGAISGDGLQRVYMITNTEPEFRLTMSEMVESLELLNIRYT